MKEPYAQDPYGLEPEISQGSFFVSSVLIEHQQFLSQMLIVHLAAFILALAKVKRPKAEAPSFIMYSCPACIVIRFLERITYNTCSKLHRTDTLGQNFFSPNLFFRLPRLVNHISTWIKVWFQEWFNPNYLLFDSRWWILKRLIDIIRSDIN